MKGAPRKHSIGGRSAALLLVALAFSACSKSSENQLYFAITSGDTALVQELLLREPRIDVNQRNARTGETALLTAASVGNTEIVRILLSRGANPNIGDNENSTPLLIASFQGHSNVVELLLNAGADVNAVESRHGMNALISASKQGHAEIVNLLLEAKADTTARFDGRTALQIAEQYNRHEVVRLLREYEGKINQSPR